MGENCTVQFRRDVLGSARDLPVAVTTDVINGAQVSLSGRLVSIDTDWVVILRPEEEFWIPRDHVLTIRFKQSGVNR